MSNFPRGRLTPKDEGELALTFIVRGNTLIVDFGKPVAWIGFSLHEVTALREAFENYERQLKETSA